MFCWIAESSISSTVWTRSLSLTAASRDRSLTSVLMLSFESAFQEYYLPFFDSAERKEKVAPSFYLAISKLAPLSSISI